MAPPSSKHTDACLSFLSGKEAGQYRTHTLIFVLVINFNEACRF